MPIQQIFEAYGNQLIAPGHSEDGSGSGGHVIQNQAGTDLTQRANLQFVDAQLSDDSTNDRTKIEVIKRVTKAQLDTLGENTDGIYETTDEDDEPWADVSDDYVEVVADGEKTIGELLTTLQGDIDFTKVTGNTYLAIISSTVTDCAYITKKYSNALMLRHFGMHSSSDDFTEYRITTSGVRCYKAELTNGSFTVTNTTNTEIPTNGTIYRLYYGTKSSTIQLNTDAQHCIMSDGETSVEEAVPKYIDVTVTTDSNGYANIKDYAPKDKTINAIVLSPKRNSIELWLNETTDNGYFGYVYGRGASPSALADTSCTIRIWKRG